MLDRASARLGRVRQQRQDNMQSLRHSMNEWARNLSSQNVSEEALVVLRRDRLCVPVKAGRQVIYPTLLDAGCISKVHCLAGASAVQCQIAEYLGVACQTHCLTQNCCVSRVY